MRLTRRLALLAAALLGGWLPATPTQPQASQAPAAAAPAPTAASRPASLQPPSGARSVGITAYGAVPDDEEDDTAAVQAALDAAAEHGGVVVVPPGVFLLSPATGAPALRLGSRTRLQGAGPTSVLRVRQGTGPYGILIGQRPGWVEDVALADLAIDQAPGDRGRAAPTPGDLGNAALAVYLTKFRGALVERVIFEGAGGVNTVSLNGLGTERGAVVDCTFRFAPQGPEPRRGYDNSAIYVHGAHFRVAGNTFQAGGSGLARTAIEVHGGPGLVTDNHVDGYLAGINVVSRGPREPEAEASGMVVQGNVIWRANHGIKLWSLTGFVLRNVVVAANSITIANAEVKHVSHAGISLVRDSVSGRLDGAFDAILLSGNSITLQREERGGYAFHDSGGLLLYPQGSISNLTVTGNQVTGAPTQGIRIQSGLGKASGVVVEGNLVADAGNNARSRVRSPIVVAGRVEGGRVGGNVVRGGPAGRSIDLAGLSPGSAVDLGSNGDGPGPAAAPLPATPLPGPGPAARPVHRLTAAGTVRLVAGPGRYVLDAAGPAPFGVAAPPGVVAGERLTLLVRNVGAGPLGPLTWAEGIKAGAWTQPAPGHGRSLDLEFDGQAWVEVGRTPVEVPN